MLGTVLYFAGTFAPTGYLPCNGAVLSIAQYATLYSLLGNRFGGDGVTTFALPDLKTGNNLVAAICIEGTFPARAEAPAAAPVQPAPATAASAPHGHAHAPAHAHPAASAKPAPQAPPPSNIFTPPPAAPDTGGNQVMGSVLTFAGMFAPAGFLPCDGRTMPINGNEALFSILGITYGGDGTTNFLRPKLSLASGNGGALQQCIAVTGVYPMRSF